MSQRWSAADTPPQTGRVALVTGATDGLGREVALALGAKGATVIVAGRNRERGETIARAIPSARFEPLDLASLADVRGFVDRILKRHDKLDVLVANAGISMPATLQRSVDGFELQMAVNFFGHFLLTSALMPALHAASGRVVTLSSLAAGQGRVDTDDLNAERGYRPMRFYALSKLAMLLFARELQKRSVRGRWGVTALSAHPGFSRTNLGEAGPRIGGASKINHVGLSIKILGPIIGQSAAAGALPALYAATVPQAQGGTYIGPSGVGGLKGYPKQVPFPKSASSDSDAEAIWLAAERLTGAVWPSLS